MWFEEKQLFVVFGLCGMVLTNRCEMMINNWSLSRWSFVSWPVIFVETLPS